MTGRDILRLAGHHQAQSQGQIKSLTSKSFPRGLTCLVSRNLTGLSSDRIFCSQVRSGDRVQVFGLTLPK